MSFVNLFIFTSSFLCCVETPTRTNAQYGSEWLVQARCRIVWPSLGSSGSRSPGGCWSRSWVCSVVLFFAQLNWLKIKCKHSLQNDVKNFRRNKSRPVWAVFIAIWCCWFLSHWWIYARIRPKKSSHGPSLLSTLHDLFFRKVFVGLNDMSCIQALLMICWVHPSTL